MNLSSNSKVQFVTPNVNDVLSGRGTTINVHPGNEKFRTLVQQQKHDFMYAEARKDKRLIASGIIEKISSQDPPGRFLQEIVNFDGDVEEIGDKEAAAASGINQLLLKKKWVVCDHEKAMSKAMHRLREKEWQGGKMIRQKRRMDELNTLLGGQNVGGEGLVQQIIKRRQLEDSLIMDRLGGGGGMQGSGFQLPMGLPPAVPTALQGLGGSSMAQLLGGNQPPNMAAMQQQQQAVKHEPAEISRLLQEAMGGNAPTNASQNANNNNVDSTSDSTSNAASSFGQGLAMGMGVAHNQGPRTFEQGLAIGFALARSGVQQLPNGIAAQPQHAQAVPAMNEESIRSLMEFQQSMNEMKSDQPKDANV